MKTIDLTTQHGRRVTIPADVGVDELDQLAATHERLAADLHEDGRREQALTEEIEAANRRRLDEGAEAMIAGRAKAKASTLAAKLAALEGRLAGARDTTEKRRRALVRVGEEINALIATNAGSWAERFDGELEAAHETWPATLEPVESQARRLAELVNLRAWASSATEGNARLRAGDLPVPGLVRRDGTAYAMGEVLAALHDVARPVERTPRKSMEVLESERRERIRQADARDAAFEERARAVSETMPKPAAA